VVANGVGETGGIESASRAIARDIGLIGGASLSTETPNQITTNKTARAHEVLELVRRVRRRFTDEHGVEVRTMLRFVDEQGQPVDLRW
jgi:UDP-N-acetylenolpyruvoylglucosamine reductase